MPYILRILRTKLIFGKCPMSIDDRYAQMAFIETWCFPSNTGVWADFVRADLSDNVPVEFIIANGEFKINYRHSQRCQTSSIVHPLAPASNNGDEKNSPDVTPIPSDQTKSERIKTKGKKTFNKQNKNKWRQKHSNNNIKRKRKSILAKVTHPNTSLCASASAASVCVCATWVDNE